MTKVFLSYVREDSPTAAKIAARLKRLGHSVWWDRHIRGGAEFAEEIDQALAEAEAVVVLWSERSIKSAWVRDEAGVGRDTSRLVPLSIDGCTPPLGFRQYHSMEYNGGAKAARQLDDAVRNLGSNPNPQPEASRTVPPPFLTRRNALLGVVAGTLAAAAVGSAFVFYRHADGEEAPSEIQPLLTQAKALIHQNTRDGQYQAIGLLQRAVEVAPAYANGWGWLGYAYGVTSHFRARQESLALQARAKAAGTHALELDPNSAMGELALATAPPFIGHWEEREHHAKRAHALDPKNDDILANLAVSLMFVGRSTEALSFLQRIDHKPLTAAEYTSLMFALWNAGRLPELDQVMKDAASLYPSQASIWFTRLQVATFAGDVAATSALAADAQGRPTGVPDDLVKHALRMATAIRDRDPRDVASISDEQYRLGRSSALETPDCVRNLSALNRTEEALTLCEAYYKGSPFMIPDSPANARIYSLEQRETEFLFEPVTNSLRGTAGFEGLMKQIGLDRYWRSSGAPPDYRHIAAL